MSANNPFKPTPLRVPAQRIGDDALGRERLREPQTRAQVPLGIDLQCQPALGQRLADTDLRLCRFFGLSNGYWLRAQAAHDTEVAERVLGPKLAHIRPWTGAAQPGVPGDAATRRR